jgi:hypothetical protein
LEDVDVIFFDELNRANPEKQASLFSIVHSGSIHGVRLPNLKAVVAALNPTKEDESYQVQEMDKAFRGRFSACIEVPADPKVSHFMDGYVSERVARAVARWWHKHVKNFPEIRDVVSPRVAHYIGTNLEKLDRAIEAGRIPAEKAHSVFTTWTKHNLMSKDTLGVNIPLGGLLAILTENEEFALQELANNGKQNQEITQDISSNVQRSMQVADTLTEAVRKKAHQSAALLKPDELWQYSNVIMALHPEHAMKLFTRPNVAMYFYNAAIKNTFPHAKEETPIYQRYKDVIDGQVAGTLHQQQR